MLLKPLKHHTWPRESPDLFSLDFSLPDFGFPFASCVIEPQPPEVALTHTLSLERDQVLKNHPGTQEIQLLPALSYTAKVPSDCII
ncbi:hypothetical protein H2248_002034 [Termitomyces sp. 'cryptogamus']|nr:hypothetical protein H2248_002034 [Termitomyces sp. 'cryptogamus']